jgi:hypothetical protein
MIELLQPVVAAGIFWEAAQELAVVGCGFQPTLCGRVLACAAF